MFKKILSASLLCFLLAQGAWATDFVTVKGTHFYRDNAPYYFIGTNLWYGPILGSKGQGGDRDRLVRELDSLKDCGIDNLRILVGPDAGSKNCSHVEPYLQDEKGELNDTLLDGLDYLLSEMKARKMLGVIYLTNSWDWSGGFGHYLKRCGYEDSPNASGEGYNLYTKYASQFSTEPCAIDLFHAFIKKIVTRKNRYTGVAYTEDPTIMAWQICNEPRAFADETKEDFYKWVTSTARLIKKLDSNHLVSTGSEGLYGCEKDENLCTRIHNDLSVDYLTVHVWPVNWRWASRDRLYEALPFVYVKATEYIKLHARMAERIEKPMVIEEFGYSRDRTMYEPSSSTMARDAFYEFVFAQVIQSKRKNGPIAGCNFWGWAGAGRPDGKQWKRGADFMADPPHEPQGWYSVYNSDSTTLKVITNAVEELKK